MAMPDPKLIDMFNPFKVLIVDDDKVIADILKDLTLMDGQERSVSVCYDGAEAIGMINKEPFDLIITDLIMPNVGGLDVLKYAKKKNPDILVIIVTGYASLETAVAAVREGAYDYIMKPCKMGEIKIVINRAIDKIKLNRQNKELEKKLKEVYQELMLLNSQKYKSEKIKSLNFFSSGMAGLHYIYNDSAPDNYTDKLQALSSLMDKGLLTESEFRTFKNHYLKFMRTEK
ncbi:MAG: response regulator [Proteobacteria bacterium]|nr:response regulator [Pseudomonadota bacterium]